MSTEPIIGLPLDMVERSIIAAMLVKYPDRKPEVAKALGISLKTLYTKMHKYGIGSVRPCIRTAKRKRGQTQEGRR